ncbi:MAG TPA: hypothetical protein VK618_06635 [Flavitalea sp.]|nr:hypothetical protein [Flavitalea sp.]
MPKAEHIKLLSDLGSALLVAQQAYQELQKRLEPGVPARQRRNQKTHRVAKYTEMIRKTGRI